MSILHHPDGAGAQGEDRDHINHNDKNNDFGILPHSVRGYLNQYNNLLIQSPPYSRCTACSPYVCIS